MQTKPLIKRVDRTFGALARSAFRNFAAQPLFTLNYKVAIVGAEEALSCTSGSIVVANHVSFLDGPFLMNNAWPHARIRATAWHAEYSDWKQWWLMQLFGVICLGSPKEPAESWHRGVADRQEMWTDERRRRKDEAVSIMNKVLAAGHHLLLFCEGRIGDGNGVAIPHGKARLVDRMVAACGVSREGLEFESPIESVSSASSSGSKWYRSGNATCCRAKAQCGRAASIAYNSALVKNPPKSWMDLTKPEYGNKQIGTVFAPSGGTTWTRAMFERQVLGGEQRRRGMGAPLERAHVRHDRPTVVDRDLGAVGGHRPDPVRDRVEQMPDRPREHGFVLDRGRRDEGAFLQALGPDGDDPVPAAGQAVARRAVDRETLLAALQDPFRNRHRKGRNVRGAAKPRDDGVVGHEPAARDRSRDERPRLARVRE